jgi:hypothetical protein
VAKVRSVWAVVPVTSIQRLFAGDFELKLKPALFSHERTLATSASVGA